MNDFPVANPEKPVLIIGAAGMDVVGRLKTPLNEGVTTPAHIHTSFGGVGRNVAENLARLGQPVVLITAVGADQYGERLIEHADEIGIDIQSVLRTSQHPTGTYLAVINASGAMHLALDDMRAITGLTPDYLRKHSDLFMEASLLFVDGNLSKDALRTAFSLARQANLLVCADSTSPALALKFQPYLNRIFMITPNLSEAALFCDIPGKFGRRQGVEVAKKLVGLGVQLAIVTLAELGLSYATSETSGHIPAMRTEIIDPTGAGDALTAAVIFGLLNDIPLDDAVRLGVSAASLTLRHKGAVLPDLSLEKLYDQLVI